MTRLTDALSCLAEIHAHLAKGEVYHGLKARPVAWSGLLGLLAAAFQPQFVGAGDAVAFVWYWIAAAAAGALTGCSGAALNYCLVDDNLARRRARIVAGQFAPCVLGGLFLTIALLPQAHELVGLFPGLWALQYGLGLFAARPYLPRATGWVALYYLFAGTLLLSLLPPSVTPSGWAVGATFGTGQLALAWVLYRNDQREEADAC